MILIALAIATFVATAVSFLAVYEVVGAQKLKKVVFVDIEPITDLSIAFYYTDKTKTDWKFERITLATMFALHGSQLTLSQIIEQYLKEGYRGPYEDQNIQVRVIGDVPTFTQKIIDNLAGVKYPQLRGESNEQRLGHNS